MARILILTLGWHIRIRCTTSPRLWRLHTHYSQNYLKSTCWLSAWSTQVSTVIDYHCGRKVEPFIFYLNIPWATSSYTLHHSSANNGGPAYFSYGGYQYTNIWGTSLIDSDSQQCSYDPPFSKQWYSDRLFPVVSKMGDDEDLGLALKQIRKILSQQRARPYYRS